jgi:nicotinate-nucleotide adenylyltransferase
MRIAYFGGTFDPPHYGHIELARQAIAAGYTDHVIFAPSFSPPHKAAWAISSFADRMAMVELAVAAAGEPGFEVSGIESRIGTVPSYTVDIMEELSRRHPADRLQLLIGSDSLIQIHTWHRVREIINKWEIITYPRKNIILDFGAMRTIISPEQEKKIRENIVNLPFFEISSSEVRKKIAKNENVGNIIDVTVLDYIQKRKLYQINQEID